MRFLTLFIAILTMIVLPAPQALANNDLSVNSLRIGTHPDKTRVVVELSRKADFRVFLMHNPTRLAIDLPAFDWKAGVPQTGQGSILGSVRNGQLQPGISRIVADLNKSATIQSAFMLPASADVPDRLVIDLVAAAGSNMSNERTYGSLTSAGNAVATPDRSEQVLKVPPRAVAIEEETRSIPTKSPPPQTSGKKPLIVIDPGHGGQDPGAIAADGTQEKNITLAAAKDLKRELEETGRYRVHLTRDRDVFIKLQDRVRIARDKGADLFISLHADSVNKPTVNGASIYTLSNTASDAQTAKLAARENQADLIAGVDLSHEDKEVANILIDLAMRDTMNQSKFFANAVVREAKNGGIQLLEKPHRFAGFAVLKAPDTPSVLIEMGFMSNSREVSQLASPAYRKKIARAIIEGVDGYFAKIRKNAE